MGFGETGLRYAAGTGLIRSCATVSSTSRPNSACCSFVIRGSKVLNLDHSLPHEDHFRDLGNTGNPGVANQLRIQTQESLGLLRIAAGSGLPFQKAFGAIQYPNCIDVSHKIVGRRYRFCELDLQIPSRLSNADSILLGETIQQLNTLLQHAVPRNSVRIGKAGLLIALHSRNNAAAASSRRK